MNTKYNNEAEYKATLEQIKSFPLVEYANMIGYTPVRKGSYFSLKEADSVMIDPRNNTYRRYSESNIRKSIIDFSMEFESKNIKEAYRDLKNLVCGFDLKPIRQAPIKEKINVKRELELPTRDDNLRNVYAYLTNSRCIDSAIVQSFIKNKNLYQDTHKNCVFVGYDRDGKANFANKRGTNTYKRFLGDCLGCDYKKCFLTGNRLADTMIVTESVIDSMSVMTVLKGQRRDLNNYSFLALSGTPKYEAVTNQLKELPHVKTLVLAVDNDASGFECIENIKEDVKAKGFEDCRIIEFLPKEKDWNAHLQQNRAAQVLKEQSISQSQSFEMEVERCV